MARTLKTYITSEGFFDKAVAAPSMKAALEAWGASQNLFQQGFAQETKDAAIVAAVMKQPGTVLMRAVGSKSVFSQHAALPDSLVGESHASKAPKENHPPRDKRGAQTKKTGKDQARKADALYKREEQRRKKQRQKELAARERAQKTREAATAKAQLALDKATLQHERRMVALEAQQQALQQKVEAEEAAWDKRRAGLEKAVSRARE